MKSIGGGHTFEMDTNDWLTVNEQLVNLVDYVHKRLIEANMSFRTVGLKIRFTGFETYTTGEGCGSQPPTNSQSLQQFRNSLKNLEAVPRK